MILCLFPCSFQLTSFPVLHKLALDTKKTRN